MEFFGYYRPDGLVGIRNYILVLPATRVANYMAYRISSAVVGTKTLLTTGEYGRHKKDRERLARFLVGIARNPNVAGVLLLGIKKGYGYPEFQVEELAREINKSQKPLFILEAGDEGGSEKTISKGIQIARDLVIEASKIRREKAGLNKICVGVKCGDSDATSGIAGNPSLGRAIDTLVSHGGTCFFSETVEIIGAEELLMERAVHKKVAQDILRVVLKAEEKARSIGEDIRTINPIPENIAAGITTLEEKSLGAIAKTGTSPVQGVLDYCEIPQGHGLYLVDAWMSSYSLLPSLAASGAQVLFYQLGGNELPPADAPLSATNPGIVAPLLTITGNPRTYEKARTEMDFSSGDVLLGRQTIEEAGGRLVQKMISVASGEITRGESLIYPEPFEVYYEGPFI